MFARTVLKFANDMVCLSFTYDYIYLLKNDIIQFHISVRLAISPYCFLSVFNVL